MTQTQRKTFVLDTSVLLAAPKALHAFEEHDVVLPLVVLRELEAKRSHPDLGYQARAALRELGAIATAHPRESLSTGIALGPGRGTLRVEINHVSTAPLPESMRTDRSHDTRILAVAANLARETDPTTVTVVTKDLPMRLLAETLNLDAQDYLADQVVVSRAYTGVETVNVPDQVIDDLYAHHAVTLGANADHITITGGRDVADVARNTGVRLLGPTKNALGVLRGHGKVELVPPSLNALGHRGRSMEQQLALAHLLNPDVGVVSLGGLAGAGKTFLALASGIEQVLESRRYDKVMVFRPLYAVGGQDLGYLPGDQAEKMDPWAAAVWDTLDQAAEKNVADEIRAQQMLDVLPLTHLRGRTLARTFIIIDEAQNLEHSVLLTALSRLGEGSKAVLCWDAAQRDNLHVGRYDGIASVVEKLKGEPLFAHTTFTKSERSPVAAMVTRLLDDLT